MMTGVIAKLLLDTLIIVLLTLTISYCWLLNRRIKILQDSKSELAQLLKYFDESTQRASESIIALQSASKKIGENIQSRIDKANFMMEDLSGLIEKSNKVADQMEASFAVNRARAKAMNENDHSASERPLERPVASAKPPETASVDITDMQAEATAQSKSVAQTAAASRERTVASLGAVLEKMVGRTVTKPAAEQNTPRKTASRAKAEQELLAMLRAGMKG